MNEVTSLVLEVIPAHRTKYPAMHRFDWHRCLKRRIKTLMTRIQNFLIALLFALALPLSTCVGADPAPIPLEKSVMIFHEWGLRDATKMVELAAKQGHRRVNFVITIHCQLDKDLKVLNYGLIRAQEGWKYEPFNEQLLALFKRHLTEAFTRAVELKLDISILPHVDAAGPQFGWRNEFDLDPLESCSGYSYQQVMIDAVANALEESVGDKTRVEFALTGEMGRTVFMYPDAYQKIMAELRQRKPLRQLKTGVSINFNKVSGKHQPTAAQSAAVQQLFADSDFLGFSCYGPVSVPPKPEDFSAMIDSFVAEIERRDVAIPKGLELHFSEVGTGGFSPSGEIAQEPSNAASSAWAGTSDPANNPWATTKMQDFRRDYYRALLAFLQSQPSEQQVTAAFLWNTGSWCPYGTDNEVFADSEIVSMIRMKAESSGK